MAAQRLLAFFCVVVSTFAVVATSAVRADDGAAKSTFTINRSEELVPRLADRKYGPAIVKRERGKYEFLDPVLKAYARLRKL